MQISPVNFSIFIFSKFILKRIVNQLVLRPSTDTIRPESATRETIALGKGELEYYQDHVAGSESNAASEDKLLVIKFPGTGGRADGHLKGQRTGGPTIRFCGRLTRWATEAVPDLRISRVTGNDSSDWRPRTSGTSRS